MSLATFCVYFLLFILASTSYASTTYNYSPTPTLYLPPPQPTTTSDIYLYLKAQNAARAAVGVPPLSWDSRLAAFAQWWANQRRYDCALKHSSGPYGENIFWGSGSSWSPAFAVQSWVVEGKYYNYYSNSCAYGKDCGHYTQIVWRSTRRIGCAKVVCYNGRGVFITCNYDPPGNYIGSRPY
ncbi:pathogenesis-related protein PR-1 [Beta vulgaris subsp. vulgaris]|uniref:pathogenesis-related protein PR-1 n=1 Tax=Beta vulgaris subsp. vulgaris TaxID=3555 RepID=UPI00203672AE|nr:pathogenesis-related protein PR-1 [Beta vulgaris subsp. vulgaris]